MEILVLDTETTSLESQSGYIVEIAIVKVDTKKGSIEFVYDEVVGYDISKWSRKNKNAWIFDNSTLELDDVRNGKPLDQVVEEVRGIIQGEMATSYNTSFDFRDFLFSSLYFSGSSVSGR